MIIKPTLILDSQKCCANIQRMMERAQTNNVRLRPHCKTHQSAVVATWFGNPNSSDGVEAGATFPSITGITVSSVEMATYFADQGWKDITIAFSVNRRQMKEINELAIRLDRLGLLVESAETVHFLQDHLIPEALVVDLWVDVDTGYHRTGLDWEASEEEIVALGRSISQQQEQHPKTRLAGLLTHPGHTYKTRTLKQVQAIHNETLEHLCRVRDILQADRTVTEEPLAISIGDTPSCSLLNNFHGKDMTVDEIRPGNFVFYDVMQAQIGSCTLDHIAVAVACPVVAISPKLKQIVVYGGAVHLSKENIELDDGDSADNTSSCGNGTRRRTLFGRVATPTYDGWSIYPNDRDVYVKGLSQEHGVIHCSDPEFLQSVQVGGILMILPIHSCLTANLLKRYQLLDGQELSMAPIPST